MSASPPVVMGRFCGAFGLRGWVRIYSYTRPKESVFGYTPWLLAEAKGWHEWHEWRELRVAEWQAQGRGLIGRLEDCTDRDCVLGLMGREFAVARENLPAIAEGEYYWADLEGLRVVTIEGIELGYVDHLLETGANDVLAVQGERLRLLPFDTEGVIRHIDLTAGTMEVDWDPAF